MSGEGTATTRREGVTATRTEGTAAMRAAVFGKGPGAYAW